MDPTIESSIGLNESIPYNRWNIYTQDVDQPELLVKFELIFSEEEIAKNPRVTDVNSTLGNDSYVNDRLKRSIEEFTDDVQGLSLGGNAISQLVDSIDSLSGILKSSEYKYTRDYHDMRMLDTYLDIVQRGSITEMGSSVLLFNPRSREYFVEKHCNITISLIESKIKSKVSTGKGGVGEPALLERENGEEHLPNDDFYLSAVHGRQVENFINLPLESADLDRRWADIEAYFGIKSASQSLSKPKDMNLVDLIVHEEDPYGRRGTYGSAKIIYDIGFFEPCMRGLNLLANGGSIVLKLISYGNRFAADLIYLYKYLFEEVTICKPGSMISISQEYYLVAMKFKRSVYYSLKPSLDRLLSELAIHSQSSEYDIKIYSFLKNLDSVPVGVILSSPVSIQPQNKSNQQQSNYQQQSSYQQQNKFSQLTRVTGVLANFVEWLVDVNDQIGLTICANIRALLHAAYDSRAYGFGEGHPVTLLDHAAYRENLGYLGRTSLYVIPPHEIGDTIVDENDQSSIADMLSTIGEEPVLGSITARKEESSETILTETGQFAGIDLRLDKIGLDGRPFGYGYNFLLVLNLNLLIQSILNSPVFRLLLPERTDVNRSTITLDYIFEYRQSREFNIREWLGILYALGDLEIILEFMPKQPITQEENPATNKVDSIIEILRKREWTLYDIFNVPVNAQSKLSQLSPDDLYRNIASEFLKTYAVIQEYKNISSNDPNNPLSRVAFLISPLIDLRFRVSYCFNGLKCALANRNHPSVIGEYEIVNMMTPAEKAQLVDSQQIVNVSRNKDFVNRLIDHAGLSIYFVGGQNELAVPDLYFLYKPDIELFASAVNRHAPIWCSANREDTKLGSSGNFFDFMTRSNPLLQVGNPNRTFRVIMAFPPMNSVVLKEVFDTCLAVCGPIIKNTKEIVPLALIIIFVNTDVNTDGLLAGAMAENAISLRHCSLKEIDRAYDPFSGIYHDNVKLKAACFKTLNSPFAL